MNQNNLEYLQKMLDHLGFGTRLNAVLESAIYKKPESFNIGLNQKYIPAEFRSDPGKGVDMMHFDLQFNKSRETDAYFLNGFEATLKRYNTDQPVSKIFDIEKHHRMTALQSYKLLCGLSLQKDIFLRDLTHGGADTLERIPVWFSLDLQVTNERGNHPLNRFYPGYGFDLEATVDRYNFKGLEDMQKRDAVIRALKYGNLIELPLELDGKVQPVYLSANPEMKTLNVYSKEMQPIKTERIFPPSTAISDQISESNINEVSQNKEPNSEQTKSRIGR
ncbi:hypothetical protein [Pedobacter soli]|uniref:Uncharacterized protein n=1 Tax=Pedobacter soli TaxID=390242 RepID=A0A1G6X0D4_9SPHI|nr:hypothetical protein [Pedobacter soli]SDD71514.1 hypothetical protein SAMN04488024_107185 [Pedobacter soli]